MHLEGPTCGAPATLPAAAGRWFPATAVLPGVEGPRSVAGVAAGDRLWCLDGGAAEVVAASPLTVEPSAAPVPVWLAADALGEDAPARPLVLAAGHRICLSGVRGTEGVLVPATALVNGTTIRRASPAAPLAAVVLVLDRPAVVAVEGLLVEVPVHRPLPGSGAEVV